MIQVVLTNQKAPLTFEKSASGGGQVVGHGFTFWVSEPPPTMVSGDYEQVVMEGTLFKQQISPRGILDFTPMANTKEESHDPKGKETAKAKAA